MDGFLGEWLNLLLRWGHMIAGIAWIGTSFYFVALDFSLKKPAGLPAGVGGEAWEVHGGGFYHVQKYLSAPARFRPISSGSSGKPISPGSPVSCCSSCSTTFRPRPI